MNLNEFLKSQPVAILAATFVMVSVATPAVYLFAQQRVILEQKQLEMEASLRIAESAARNRELQLQLTKLENDLINVRRDVAQIRDALDVALKTVVEIQKRKDSNQK